MRGKMEESRNGIMNNDIIFLEPVCTHNIWGGTRLNREFGYPIEGDDIGECWGISAHPNGDGTVASGAYKGMKLSELWEKHPELFGNTGMDRFPLLIKIIDAKDDLSIQVHPDDAYAKVHENGSLGKTECWFILDCKENATLVVGHNAKTKEELEQMIHEGKWKEFIREIPIKPGDFIQIDPGTVHAIKGGTLLLETQQSSDITYRVYDYDRKWNGKLRELHVKQSLDVIKTPFQPAKDQRSITHTEGADLEHLETCPYYTVEKYDIHGTWDHVFEAGFVNASVIEGEGSINGRKIKKGDHFIIPADFGTCSFEGNLSLICSWV